VGAGVVIIGAVTAILVPGRRRARAAAALEGSAAGAELDSDPGSGTAESGTRGGNGVWPFEPDVVPSGCREADLVGSTP
jgi:hypothetical protein